MAQSELEFAVRHGSNKVRNAIESIGFRDPKLGQDLRSMALGFSQITDALCAEIAEQNKRIARIEQAAQKSYPIDGTDS